MKSKVNGEAFYASLKKVSKVLGKSAMGILDHIRLDFEEGVCRLTATDLNSWLMAELPAQGDAFSCVLSDTESMARACRFYRGDLTVEYHVSQDIRRLTLSAGSKQGEFSVGDGDLYPVYQPEETEALYATNAQKLYERVRRIGYATAQSAHRPELGAVHFEGSHLWCLDGNRLACCDDETLTVTKPFLVPLESLTPLRVFGDCEIQIFVSKGYAAFKSSGITLLCRLTQWSEGKRLEDFNKFRTGDTYKLDRSRFLDGVRYLEHCVRGKKTAVALFENGELSLWSGDCRYQVSMEIQDCHVQFGFEPIRLRQALEQMGDCATVWLTTAGGAAPILLSSEAGDMALLAPVRVPESRKERVA